MSGEKVKISVSNITKRFELMKTRSEKILNLFSFLRSKKRDFWALKGVTFDVYAGEAIGIVGLNGSGKSTLLNIVSEIYPPTTGDLTINGDTSIISIGAGLKPALTGRDNIRLKLLMSGLTNKQIKQVMPTIIGFSELGDFIDQPVKSYSSGMKAKLGFSIMAHTDPDIMIIDEALSVGDSTFANKSFDKIREFKKQGKTIFFVSHSAGQVKQIADRVIWMHFGEMKEIGPATDVMSHYEKWQKEFNKKPKAEREEYIVKQKHEQRNFSASEIALKQLKINKPKNAEHSRVARFRTQELEKKNAKLVKKATKQTQKKIQNIRFGILNWLIIFGIIVLIGILCSNTLNNAEARRAMETNLTHSSSIKKPKNQEPSKSSSKANTSTTSSSSTAISRSTINDANGNGIPDDQEIVDANSNGIADNQEVVDNNGNGIPDNQETVDNTYSGNEYLSSSSSSAVSQTTVPEAPASNTNEAVNDSTAQGGAGQ
ncbi:ABC transporter ATP-binding protein [Leuconostoc mesenteroides]|uniref:ABC transporter ATP-binding protein n=1 Tax=Leuconostoc mesenteroides TaxID=1245 RepID=UPI00107F66E9|nr:ABC transporter ATP-binding protein [Leuconostoc mesenteroides]TGD34758.1 ABC transporter ATP-binding protein [Leuconostoc mesenteroides]